MKVYVTIYLVELCTTLIPWKVKETRFACEPRGKSCIWWASVECVWCDEWWWMAISRRVWVRGCTPRPSNNQILAKYSVISSAENGDTNMTYRRSITPQNKLCTQLLSSGTCLYFLRNWMMLISASVITNIVCPEYPNAFQHE